MSDVRGLGCDDRGDGSMTPGAALITWGASWDSTFGCKTWLRIVLIIACIGSGCCCCCCCCCCCSGCGCGCCCCCCCCCCGCWKKLLRIVAKISGESCCGCCGCC